MATLLRPLADGIIHRAPKGHYPVTPHRVAIAIILLAGLSACAQYPQTGDAPLRPIVESRIAFYAPGEDLSNLTMTDYRKLSMIIDGNDFYNQKNMAVTLYVQRLNARVAAEEPQPVITE